MWLSVKSAKTPSIRRLSSVWLKNNISGRLASATTQAYMVMSSPAPASLSPKSLAIALKSPMGINSLVLKTKVPHASVMTGSHEMKRAAKRFLGVIFITFSFVLLNLV